MYFTTLYTILHLLGNTVYVHIVFTACSYFTIKDWEAIGANI